MINQKKFRIIVLSSKKEPFVIYVAYLESKISIYLACKAPIALLFAEKVSIPEKYADFSDIFSKKSIAVLSNRLNINKHIINLESDKQPLYKSIYSLSLVELKIFKTYIEVNLANRFFQPSKFLTWTYIFFIQKSDRSFCLPVDYYGLNNLTIKNQYPLPLIGKLLDQLGKIKWFTQLNLLIAYYCIKIKKGNK